MSEDFWMEANKSRRLKGQDSWIGADEMETPKKQEDMSVGLWSRSIVLRVIAWIVMIQGAIILAVFASAYLSGFGSALDMINSLRVHFGI